MMTLNLFEETVMKRRNFELIVFTILAVIIAAIGIKLYIKPVSGIKMSGISFTSYKYADSDQYTQASSGKVSNVSNLDIDWVSGYIELIAYNGKDITFQESAASELASDERMCFWKDGNTLRIKFTSSGLRNFAEKHKKLTVYVPANIILDNLNIEVVSADVTITGLNTVETDYDSVSGNLIANNMSAVSFDGNSVSGEVFLNLNSKNRTNSIEIDTISGDVALELPKDRGFELSFDTVSGDLSCKSEVFFISKNKIKRGDASLEIEIDTVSGDVTIE